MKKLFIFLIVFTYTLTAQNQWFSLTPFWEKGGPGMAFNIEAFNMNKDGNLDVVVGNWNNTYVYYGGYGILDTTKDVVYTGRMLAVCDYNGDGFDDMIAMHFTNFDSARGDYDGELLFYWGSDTTGLAIDTIPDYSIPLPTLYPTFDRFTMGYITVGIQKGDLNTDGKIDIILSSTENTEEPGGIVSRGKIYIYMGKETPTDTADFTLIGQEVLAYYGHFFQIGNINGDEYDDLLISSNRISTTAVSYDSINYLHI
ncbi:MAG: VCBS repeat-containing protein, partial [Ignavibacteriaceae bacterium]|nr:VCBS repeat-containing protein [Ignavibacteriaceae bacterium]